MFKTILYAVWTFSLEKTWNWIWSKTEIDEKTIEVVNEIEVRSEIDKKELKDVVDAIKGVPIKPKKRYYKPKAKVEPKK